MFIFWGTCKSCEASRIKQQLNKIWQFTYMKISSSMILRFGIIKNPSLFRFANFLFHISNLIIIRKSWFNYYHETSRNSVDDTSHEAGTWETPFIIFQELSMGSVATIVYIYYGHGFTNTVSEAGLSIMYNGLRKRQSSSKFLNKYFLGVFNLRVTTYKLL